MQLIIVSKYLLSNLTCLKHPEKEKSEYGVFLEKILLKPKIL